MRAEGVILGFKPGAAVPPRTVVKIGAADNTVIPAAAGTDRSIGIADTVGSDANSDTVSVVLTGVAEAVYGGAVTRGDKLTSNASGQVITATGTPIQVIGIALETGVAGDIRGILVAPMHQ